MENKVKMDGIENFEDLQEKLNGVFDLNRIEDCYKIINTLLISLKNEKQAGQKHLDALRSLAFMVIKNNPQAREKACDIMSSKKQDNHKVYNFLMDMVNTINKAQGMTNEELIDAVMDKVWSGFDGASLESALLEELVLRMRKSTQK